MRAAIRPCGRKADGEGTHTPGSCSCSGTYSPGWMSSQSREKPCWRQPRSEGLRISWTKAQVSPSGRSEWGFCAWLFLLGSDQDQDHDERPLEVQKWLTFLSQVGSLQAVAAGAVPGQQAALPRSGKTPSGARDGDGNQAGRATGSWPEATMRCPRSK